MNHSVETLLKQIEILKKRLERSEHSRRLMEQAKDHYDLVYRSSIEKLDAQKNLLDIKNKELDLIQLELLAKNQALLEASTIDALTRIYNRRKISELLQEEFLHAQRYQLFFSIILIDIDWFKLVNDTYGHQVGDQVLHVVSQLMKDSLRVTEHIGRWGGEEFMIVLQNTNAEKAYILAERIRLKIAGYSFPTANHLTCSFGIAEYSDDTYIETIIKKADKALYQAKETRNASHIYNELNPSF